MLDGLFWPYFFGASLSKIGGPFPQKLQIVTRGARIVPAMATLGLNPMDSEAGKNRSNWWDLKLKQNGETNVAMENHHF